MAPTTTVRLTPLADLLDRTLRGPDRTRPGLGTFLAVGRTPGPGWRTFDKLAETLSDLTGRTVTRPSVKTYAEDFEIPDTRTIDGHKMPRPVTPDVLAGYLNALNPNLVDVEYVREHLLTPTPADAPEPATDEPRQ